MCKRKIVNPESFVGKRIDATKWNIPSGYALCAFTGKFFKHEDLEVTFRHWVFDKAFLIRVGLYVEDAEWLSNEGYGLIEAGLKRLGLFEAYLNSFDHEQDYIAGRCYINEHGTCWSTY